MPRTRLQPMPTCSSAIESLLERNRKIARDKKIARQNAVTVYWPPLQTLDEILAEKKVAAEIAEREAAMDELALTPDQRQVLRTLPVSHSVTSEQIRLRELRKSWADRTRPIKDNLSLSVFLNSGDLKAKLSFMMYGERDDSTSLCCRCEVCFGLDDMMVSILALQDKDEHLILGDGTKDGLMHLMYKIRLMIHHHVLAECEDVFTPLFL